MAKGEDSDCCASKDRNCRVVEARDARLCDWEVHIYGRPFKPELHFVRSHVFSAHLDTTLSLQHMGSKESHFVIVF